MNSHAWARCGRRFWHLWFPVLLVAMLAMHSLGLVHLLLHNHNHNHSHNATQSKVDNDLGHEADDLVCLVWGAVATAAGLVVLPHPAVFVGIYAVFFVPFLHNHLLAFLFVTPPVARAPPRF